jgi:hypothetical protein
MFFKILFTAASVIYPFLIFYFLVILKMPLRQLSLFVISFALLAFLTTTSKKKASLKLLYGLPCFSLA